MGITPKHLTERLTEAVAHGKVSQKLAQSILVGTGYTPQTAPLAVRQVLANVLRANADKFDPTAQQALDAFINPAGSAQIIDDGFQVSATETPGMSAYQDYQKYGPAFGRLFAKGRPSGGDLKQGAAGDCYFDCSIASVAFMKPEIIRNMLKENADGTITVTFQRVNTDGTFTPMPVTVDRALPDIVNSTPANNGKLLYDSAQRGDLWPGIVEKAFAKLFGSYDAIGNGGWPEVALGMVTGQPVKTLDTSAVAPADLFAQIQSATQAHQPTVCYTFPRAGHEADFDATGMLPDGETGVVPSHAYSVFSAKLVNGQQMVELRNPWGSHEPGSDGTDDGVFMLPIDQFIKLYPSVSFTAPPLNASRSIKG